MMETSKTNTLFGQDLEDLIPFTTLRISALTSAAKISKQVTSVTIGPNSVQITDENFNTSNSLNGTHDESKTSNNSSEEQKQSKKKTPIRKVFSETPEIDVYDSEPPSPKPINIDDIKSVSQKYLKKQAERDVVTQTRKELAERAERVREADKLRQERFLAATRAAERSIHERIIEQERILMETVANEEREAQEFEAEQQQRFLEVKQREAGLKERSKALEKFRAVHALFKQGIERFLKAYNDMDKELQAAFVNYKTTTLPLIKTFEGFVQMIGKGNFNQELIENAEKLQKDMDRLTNDMISKFNEIKVAEQNAKEAEEEKRKQEQQAREAEAAAALAAMPESRDAVDRPPPASPQTQQQQQQQQQQQVSNALSQFVSEQSLVRYESIMNVYKQHSEAVKQLSEDQSMKKYRMNCQIAINTPINSISAISRDHLTDKFRKLEALLRGDAVSVGNAQVSVQQHSLGKVYVTLLISRKFVNQSDTIMSNDAKAEFPLAAIVVALWQKFPEVGQFFLAYLYRDCPFFVPYFLPRIQGQSDEDYMKSLGYRYTNGVIEKHDLYLKRMSGIARLYAAIWITKPRQGETAPHPHNLENGWRWLCEILNLDPLPEICATLIFEVLQVAGHAFLQHYGKQFVKLLLAIQNQYFSKLNQVDQGGPKARLEDFVTKALRERQIKPPDNPLGTNYW